MMKDSVDKWHVIDLFGELNVVPNSDLRSPGVKILCVLYLH